jgi:hypothetical protein
VAGINIRQGALARGRLPSRPARRCCGPTGHRMLPYTSGAAYRPLASWPQTETPTRENAQIAILDRAFSLVRSCGQGTGSNCRPSAFQELHHSESTYLENAPTAQLTRIGAADRLFSVPLTRITSVPECAVSSVGFLWGSAAVSRSCGVSVGLAEALDRSSRSDVRHQVPQLPETDDTSE